MKSSSLSGDCSVCGHMNTVHQNEPCGARNGRKNIKVCGSTLHYIPSLLNSNQTGWVVCNPCPDHGRQGKKVDYSSCPVIDKDAQGNIIIIQEGVKPLGEDEDAPTTNLEANFSNLYIEDGIEGGSSSRANRPSAIDVKLYNKRDYVRFMHLGKELKTKPEEWSKYEAGGNLYYLYTDKDSGQMFYTFTWPEEQEQERGSSSKSKSKSEKKDKDKDKKKKK